MRAGKMDSVVVIQRDTGDGGTDDYGNPIEGWTDLVTLRAEIIQASTAEYIRSYGASDETVIIFRTWYVDGITNSNRVVYDGLIHNIKETKELGRRRGLEIRAVSTGQEA